MALTHVLQHIDIQHSLNKGENMGKHFRNWIISSLAILTLLTTGFLLNTYIIIPYADHNEVMQKTFILSPNGKYKAEIRELILTGGYDKSGELEVISKYSLVKLVNMENGKQKDIYYNKGSTEISDIRWIDNVTISINGIKLKVKFSIYDYRIHFWK